MGTVGLPKLLKKWSFIDIWPFYCKVKFASLCIYMGKMLRISNDFSSGLSVPNCSNFSWSLPWAGEWKIAKIVVVHWPRWTPFLYTLQTFKNLLLQNRGCLMAESLYISSGTGGQPNLLKWWLYIDIWPFHDESSLLT